MLLSLLLLPALASQALAGCAFAKRAADGSVVPDLEARAAAGAVDDAVDAPHPLEPRATKITSRVLIGDLVTTISSPVGTQVAGILLGTISGRTVAEQGTKPVDPVACAADPCCAWYDISNSLVNTFRNNGGCGDTARAAVRGGFHDAATWSASEAAKGDNCCGADGSLLLNPTEINRTDNLGLQALPGLLLPIYEQYQGTNVSVSMADLIQMAANVATVLCTKGPRVRSFVGRKDSNATAPTGLLPFPNMTAPVLISLFEDKTIISDDLIALVGAHTTAKEFFVTPKNPGQPLDQSPGVWDVQFYLDTVAVPKPAGIYRLASDIHLSKYNTTSALWTDFGANQTLWNEAYSTAYVRLSMLGVNNINSLAECTTVLPIEQDD